MDTYFFIPATKLHKVPEVRATGVTAIILDLEDAIASDDWLVWLDRILADTSLQDCYLRLPLHGADGELDLKGLARALAAGFHRLVLPKLRNAEDMEEVLTLVQPEEFSEHWRCLLLVETPRLWVDLPNYIDRWSSYLTALALGSHDLMQQLGSTHSAAHLLPLQQQLLILAKAYELEAVDLAVMELADAAVFEREVRRGFELGYQAKFILHPWQLQQLRQIPFYDAKELAWARAVEAEWQRVRSADAFTPVRIQGQVVERPHLEKMQRILKYFADQSSTNES